MIRWLVNFVLIVSHQWFFFSSLFLLYMSILEQNSKCYLYCKVNLMQKLGLTQPIVELCLSTLINRHTFLLLWYLNRFVIYTVSSRCSTQRFSYKEREKKKKKNSNFYSFIFTYLITLQLDCNIIWCLFIPLKLNID